LATLIYTSGTTGKPKGVRLRHQAWVYTGGVIADMGLLNDDDLQLLWLPLAHAFGKVLIATQLACGFASAIDGRVDKIVENTGVVKPTFMGAARASSRRPTPRSSSSRKAPKPFCRVGVRGGQRGRPPPPRRQVRVAALGASAEAVRRAGVRQDRDVFGGRSGSSYPVLRHSTATKSQNGSRPAGLLILEGYGPDRVVRRGVHQPTGQYSSAPSACRSRAPRCASARRRDPVTQRLLMAGYHTWTTPPPRHSKDGSFDPARYVDDRTSPAWIDRTLL